jgi:prepilin peptidase CpaA
MISHITTISVAVIFLLLIYASYTDVLYRKIKNKCVILVLIFSIVLGLSYGNINIITPALFLIIGYVISGMGGIGAGDVKLIFALLIGIPETLVFPFFIMTCLLGIPVALLFLIASRFIMNSNFKTVPFGIAIAIGYITVTL